MKLGLIRRISKEDISRASSDVPKWIDAFLSPLNEFIEKVGLALQNRLTFENNFLCKIIQTEFTHNTALEVNPSVNVQNNLRVRGVIPVSAGGQVVDKFGWSQLANGNLSITFNFDGGTSSTKATCYVIILLG